MSIANEYPKVYALPIGWYFVLDQFADPIGPFNTQALANDALQAHTLNLQSLACTVVRAFSPNGTPTTVVSCFNPHAILYAVEHVNPADVVKIAPVARVGMRVRIHPASDWFMRGATHGVITSLRGRVAYVKLENIGPAKLRARIFVDLLMKAGQ